jgi:hypothetical protein
MKTDRPAPTLQLITIPSADAAFRAHVNGVAVDARHGAAALERRLRRVFPRVVVRERVLSGESPAWYVYRDGAWRSSADPAWWEDDSLPRVALTSEGWLAAISATAAGLLGIDAADAQEHHFTDFVVPGTLDDSLALLAIVASGDPLTATVRLRPTTGDVVAVDFHAAKSGDGISVVLRLATDIDMPAEAVAVPRPGTVLTSPPTDVAFRSYVLRALDRMPEPTMDGLALRLRRLYPHAAVTTDGEAWLAERDRHDAGRADDGWWHDPDLPRVRYDAQAWILEANAAARAFLGHDLVGHHWQDFVTAGSTDEVSVMLDILTEVGAAESRFRMPRSDGSLVEFDSYTTVAGEEFVTVMKPV